MHTTTPHPTSGAASASAFAAFDDATASEASAFAAFDLAVSAPIPIAVSAPIPIAAPPPATTLAPPPAPGPRSSTKHTPPLSRSPPRRMRRGRARSGSWGTAVSAALGLSAGTGAHGFSPGSAPAAYSPLAVPEVMARKALRDTAKHFKRMSARTAMTVGGLLDAPAADVDVDDADAASPRSPRPMRFDAQSTNPRARNRARGGSLPEDGQLRTVALGLLERAPWTTASLAEDGQLRTAALGLLERAPADLRARAAGVADAARWAFVSDSEEDGEASSTGATRDAQRAPFDETIVAAAALGEAYAGGFVALPDVRNALGGDVARLVAAADRIRQAEAAAQYVLPRGAGKKTAVPGGGGGAPLPPWSVNGQSTVATLLAAAEDWRAVAAFIAPRLYTLATGSRQVETRRFAEDRSRPEEDAETRGLARDAFDVYAPLAHACGLSAYKNELEGLAFRCLYPRQHAAVRAELDERSEEYNQVLNDSHRLLKRALVEDLDTINHVKSLSVAGRTKTPFSVWCKMRQKNCRADEVLDTIALRVVLEPSAAEEAGGVTGEALCYHVLDLVHAQWPHMDFKVKDYCSDPKDNGYRSLHTTSLLRYHGLTLPLEVQIRTSDMHHDAEHGGAAHHRYKQVQRFGAVAENDAQVPVPTGPRHSLLRPEKAGAASSPPLSQSPPGLTRALAISA